MNVVYVNHTGVISGGERSLLGLLGALPDELQPLLATPRGDLQAAAERLRVPTATITGTAGSLRLHPLHTPQAVGELGRAALQVGRAARRHRAQLLHANSIRAGIVLALARVSAAKVVHVRDCLPPGPLSTATMRLLGATATTIVANSNYTASSVQALAPHARTEVVYNAIDVQCWDPERIDRVKARAGLGEAGGRAVLLGVVAQLSPWKGQDTAIEALRLLCGEGIDAHLLLIGSAKFVSRATRFDNEAYVARLRRQIADAGLEDRVSWLGEREDVPELVRALDVLLLPSWEEPFGRALIEAMALGVPVVSTNVGGPPEIVEDGREGLLVAPREPAAWAGAIRRIADSPALAQEMGRAGQLTVQRRFTIADHVAAMLAVYRRALA
ncbi:MAG: glycosyltransferase family 1 protein [Solirubrobacterales bacterium]|jgi:glycosyltransferase involved in cell wall biosynthesis|nr:glycosyltransferase family 1 protein [Solirubrobacterales bacterium]